MAPDEVIWVVLLVVEMGGINGRFFFLSFRICWKGSAVTMVNVCSLKLAVVNISRMKLVLMC